ncbi:endonuclease MutS2 [Stomatobaculum longum]|uniref:endonuclease MutS2 n=1 Tax=Stomatobaculum longum TaxID=796942 RepID=UPI002805AE66|nr:endonuclease MutS2 [Stomatobaculum longum]
MNSKTLHTLEFDKIIALLAERAVSAPGKALCHALVPMTDLSEIERAQAETEAALSRIRMKGELRLSGLRDVSASVKRLDVGGILSTSELYAISTLLDLSERARNYGAHEEAEPDPDALEASFTALSPLPKEKRELKRCILSEELVADTASAELSRIRRQMKTADERMHSALQEEINRHKSYLMDTIVTMRNGSYCLAVKSEYKSKLPGVVHDQSSTGSTVFIEPLVAVRLNNEYRELIIAEQQEITKILAALSALLTPCTAALLANQKILAALDFVFAKARLASSMQASKPLFNTERIVEIKDGRHPLIPRDKVVPISIRIGEDFTLLIITGPNTGGKTVSLKTMGLFTLMGQAGLHIPAFQGSRLAVFRDVFADIGDEQSIEQSLSTFSGHMKNVVEILAAADSDSLCLFDELGAGTDPTEGAALAIAILSFLQNIGARTVATTHYSELKVYALSAKGVENASCEFDVATLRPTYRLLIGIPGKSNAFAISKKLGLPDYIIEEAKTHIEQNDAAFEDLLTRLEADRRTIEAERKEILAYRTEIEELKNRHEKADQNLDERKERILEKARAEAERILAEAKESADQSIRRINRLSADSGLLRELEKERTGLRERLKSVEKTAPKKKTVKAAKPAVLHIGDSVRVLSMDHDAIVSTLPDKNNRLFVRMGVLRTQVSADDVVLIEEEAASAKGAKRGYSGAAPTFGKASHISPEINLIGKTVDEALGELDKYLDDALLAHLNSVRVIHGRGTGALKKGVLAWLKKQPYVKKFEDAHFDDGGEAVTVVTFR